MSILPQFRSKGDKRLDVTSTANYLDNDIEWNLPNTTDCMAETQVKSFVMLFGYQLN